MSPIDSITDDELQALRDRVAELEALFDLQWRRAEQATKDWQAATGKDDTWPDYGDMLVWLMGERDGLLTRLASAERVVEKLPKCWRLNENGTLVQDVPVVPGMELVSTFYGDPVLPPRVVSEVRASGWRFSGSEWYDAEKSERRCYSTESAALAAKGGAS